MVSDGVTMAPLYVNTLLNPVQPICCDKKSQSQSHPVSGPLNQNQQNKVRKSQINLKMLD